MSEANIDVVLEPDVTKEGIAPSERPAAAAEDPLPITRLPPIAPPPMRASMPSVSTSAPLPRPSPPVSLPSATGSLETTTRFPPESGEQAKPSWFRALLTSTSPPPAMTAADSEALVLRRSVAVGCVVAACAFAIIALIFAFRPPALTSALPPVVAATVIVATAIQAVGAGALSYGLLRIAERLFAVPASWAPAEVVSDDSN
jgi:hypothetical protein